MKHLLILILPFLLIACEKTSSQPAIPDAYFAAKYSYTVILAGAVGYKDVCVRQQKVNHCHAVVAKLKQLDNAVKAAETNMDTAMLSGDTTIQQSALTAYTGAISALKTYKEENVK